MSCANVDKKITLGLYGGTFAPPHIGHIRAADAMIRQFSLDMLLIMPAALPPHKKISPDDKPELRLDMTKIAFGDLCRRENAAVSELEIRRSGVSYTSDTLTTLSGIYNVNGKIKLLCGTDMFLTLDGWHDAETIFRLADIVYVRRRDDADDDGKIAIKREYYHSVYGVDAVPLDIEPFAVSSTQIRDMIMDRGVGYAVEAGYIGYDVGEYIKKRRLYGEKQHQ